jgi:two-component system, OmpR family, sensor kinase
MSLTARLSVFFFFALAIVLLGFSLTLYLLARVHLFGQLDERLQHAIETLEAAVDIEPGGLEWEPADRQISLGLERVAGAVRWAVRRGDGALLDQSANSAAGGFPVDWSPAVWPRDGTDRIAFGALSGWRLAARRLKLDELLRQGRGHPADRPGYEAQYPILVLVAGAAPAPVETTLRKLALVLALLSLGILIVSVAAGRWLCRRALEPVSRMATSATAMTAADLEQRLPMPGTNDELAALGRAFNDLLGRLHDAFGQLRAAYEVQRRFAGNASHQLRTPLAAILSQVQVALRRDRQAGEYRQVLEKVEREGARLRRIVESLLLLAQPESPRAELELVDLATWVPEHVRRWENHTRAADLSVEVEGPGPLFARVHCLLLAQLVDNLIENAFKYSESGTPVVVRASRDEGCVLLEVLDRGRGLDPGEVNHIFEPFFRGERARRNGSAGTGLGLAVVEQIARSFNGSIEVGNEPGRGCRFVLRLTSA